MKREQRRPLARIVGATALAVCAACIVAAAIAPRPQTSAQLERSIALQLKCPTCVAESVADSTVPMARAMRAVIADQVAAGESRDEIVAHFISIYGTGILLDPAPSAWSLLVCLVPLALLAVLLVAVRRRSRWRRVSAVALVAAAAAIALPAVAPQRPVTPPAHNEPPDAAAILQSAVASQPGDAVLRAQLAQSLSGAGRHADALVQLGVAYRLDPDQAQTARDYAVALARSGDEQAALTVLDHLLEVPSGDDRSLFLLGTLLMEQDVARGADLLERYLQRHPDAHHREEILDAIRSLVGGPDEPPTGDRNR